MGIVFLCSGGRNCPTRQPVTPHRAANPHSPNRSKSSDGSSPLPAEFKLTSGTTNCTPSVQEVFLFAAPPSLTSSTAWGSNVMGTAEAAEFFSGPGTAGATGLGAIFTCFSGAPVKTGTLSLIAVISVGFSGRLYRKTFVTVTGELCISHAPKQKYASSSGLSPVNSVSSSPSDSPSMYTEAILPCSMSATWYSFFGSQVPLFIVILSLNIVIHFLSAVYKIPMVRLKLVSPNVAPRRGVFSLGASSMVTDATSVKLRLKNT
ncbi:hypothetical protein ECC02_009322 [Trypanosoma cruzi]|uniref:Uncharacterized protein n=1 Tax=Trypanosoma cruzi TaxID=5693 RepID=A0A7J6XUW2_TRYCR|nr:hypothetical protein ECC02_009322 [Trypanosoma cruzi]